MRRSYVLLGSSCLVLALQLAGCSDDAGNVDSGGGSGVLPTAGAAGSVTPTGGASAAGATSAGNGGVATAGAASGGVGTTAGAGGSPSGGAATGGASTGGNGGSAGGSAGSGGSSGNGGGSSGSGGTSGGGSAGTSTGGVGGSSGGGSAGGGSGGSATCSKPAAPANLQNTIDLTWKEMTGGFAGKTGARGANDSIEKFKNSALDAVMENGGTLNFCVRYESDVKVSLAQRDKVSAALQRGVDEWFSKIKGHDCFPYDKVTTKVTGWATVKRETLDWTDTSVPLYINQIGNENVAQCPNSCSRFVRYHNGQSTKGYSYPDCPGGGGNRFDMHLWLTEGMGFGGAGGDWGQRLDRAYYMNDVDAAHLHIWLHEFGHGLGFPDYYNWDVWAPNVAVPNSVMVAGLATLVTEWDSWMFRFEYSKLKARWQ